MIWTSDSGGFFVGDHVTYDPGIHRRRSVRLQGYDYARAGAYFLTICANNRVCLFGDLVDGEMRLNAAGRVVIEEWARTAAIRPRIGLDTYIVMPNHIHGIIVIGGAGCRGTLQRAPTDERQPTSDSMQRAPTVERFGQPTSDSIPTIIRLFKSAATKRINEIRRTPGVTVWQRNYYEHVIHNDESLNHIREYIVNNPAQWEYDRENPVGARCNVPLPPKDEPWRI